MDTQLKNTLGLKAFIVFSLICSVSSTSFSYGQVHKKNDIAKRKLASIQIAKTLTPWQPKQSKTKKAFMSLVDRYFEDAMKQEPIMATEMGFHEYDAFMPNYSVESVNGQISLLNDYLKQFQLIKPSSLDSFSQGDRELIIADIQGKLHELQSVQSWRNNPDFYPSTVNTAIFSLVKRNFAPLKDRLKSVIEREKLSILLLKQGKENVTNPPKIYTEIALEQMPGIIEFFEKSMPETFVSIEDTNDDKLKTNFKTTNAELTAELKSYQSYLKNTLLAKSNGNFALGADKYAKKLLYEEMVDENIDSLLEKGYAELRRLQKEFALTAHEIDPNKTQEEVFVGISSNHPKPNELIVSVKNLLSDIREFCISKNIVTIPKEEQLTVEETPPFMRALTFASMDMPGPFETKAKEAYYNVTLPEANWSPEKAEEHMRTFCYQDLLNTSVHEAYPGHYLQGLWVKTAPSKTRKFIHASSNAEGWAHYCEEMMVQQGLSNYDKKLKLVQLHDALLRCCRYIVGIKMHTQGMTVDEGIQFFMKEGYVEKANAERETKRGTSDPTYLVYTLGKLQILSLLDDYKKQKGDSFSLKEFHNNFLAQGVPPIKIIKQVLLRPKK
jgi:uncharacterized protein (DUF885 family)